MKTLPIGIQSFANIKERDGIYVDKTRYIYDLLHGATSYYFLSRPRRFGKSLLLSTLSELFQGNKKLFEDTWIADKIDFKPHPVLHFDMSGLDYKEQSLHTALIEDLLSKAEDFNITLVGKVPKSMFKELVKKLSKQENVVILIDEYDKPIHDFLDNIKQAEANRKSLANFYGVIKGIDDHLRFCMLTGVSRFSKMSIFSELNHLADITLNPHYAGMLGYTQEELEAYFTAYLENVAQKRNLTLAELLPKVKRWYNGYTWDGKTPVYNPFSILNFLEGESFYNYWFDTGTPTFLTKLLHKKNAYNFEEILAEQFDLASNSITDMDWFSLLFQTGYLTIKKININLENDKDEYTLAYPNYEVKDAMLRYMLIEFNYSKEMGAVMPKINKLIRFLENHEIAEFVELFNTIFASIPSQIFLAKAEAYYHAVVYLTLQLIGVQVQAEVTQSKGRPDAVIFLKNAIYILEFKLNKSANFALQQIHDNQYYAPYLHAGKEVRLLGLNMTSEKKEITDFESEMVK